MELFGFGPVIITLIVCLVGNSLKIYIGKVKHPESKFSFNVAFMSFIVGVLASVGLVAPVIDAIPGGTASIVILPVIAGQIIIVMKSESIGKDVSKLLKPKSSKMIGGEIK